MGSFKKFCVKCFEDYKIAYFFWAFIINLVIEELARKGIEGFIFLAENPMIFFYNTLIIYTTLLIAGFFKRRTFAASVITVSWVTIGIINGVILIQRMTPFTVKDLHSVPDMITMITNYFTITEIVLIALSVTALSVSFILLWVKKPKSKNVDIKKNLIAATLALLFTFLSTGGLIRIGALSTFFGNLAYAYEDYGVPYCFINTWLNEGIRKPGDYTKERVKSIFSADLYNEKGDMRLVQKDEDEKYPNILFLQLESFVDPSLFKNIKTSTDPMPNYRQLMKDYSSGSLSVPACGAGTANTEFEVMTGLSVRFFGPGEYPFKGILKKKQAESIAWDLKSLGYKAHAIHNHRALFYNRNIVFDNLGYDDFTSVEFMSDVPKTPKNWAKDYILTDQIMYALKSTESRDLIYTISVQGHGQYPKERLISEPEVTVTEAPSEEVKWQYEYYVNMVYEMDKFVKALTDTLEDYDEKVVLVMYGDHIPALYVKEKDYDAKDLYQTQYIIWSNFKMPKKDMDLTAYQLAAEVMDRVGIHEGTVIKYHQNSDHDSKDYLPNLKLLGYDMLYGHNYIYGGANPFKKSGMRLGMKKVTIDEVAEIGGKYFIKGNNFTEYSKVTIDGKTLKTIYLGPKLLGLLETVGLDDASRMKVSQIDKSNKEIISTTE